MTDELGEATAALVIHAMTETDKSGSMSIFRQEDGAHFHIMWGSASATIFATDHGPSKGE